MRYIPVAMSEESMALAIVSSFRKRMIKGISHPKASQRSQVHSADIRSCGAGKAQIGRCRGSKTPIPKTLLGPRPYYQ